MCWRKFKLSGRCVDFKQSSGCSHSAPLPPTTTRHIFQFQRNSTVLYSFLVRGMQIMCFIYRAIQISFGSVGNFYFQSLKTFKMRLKSVINESHKANYGSAQSKIMSLYGEGVEIRECLMNEKIYSANDEKFNGKCIQYGVTANGNPSIFSRGEKLIDNVSMSEKYSTKTHKHPPTLTLTVLFSTILSLHSVFVLMIVIIVDSVNAIHIIEV